MQSYLHRYRRTDLAIVSACCLVAAPAFGGDYWVTYNNETSTRLVSNPAVGAADNQEKDYAWGDVNHDGWTDLIVVRKQPFTVGTQGRSNVLFMNLNGVLTDQTAQWIPDFLDAIEDRDVALVDVDNDGWDDIVTAAACNDAEGGGPDPCDPTGISDDSRLYMNLGNDGGGSWLGYGPPIVLFGTLGNNFCAVAAGDINNDGYVDLYFVSYNDNFEDQMLMNGGPGNPGVFTIENNRLTIAMRSSNFGTNAVIVDFNGDGWADIVKSEDGPVEIFRNGGNGFFDLLDPTYLGTAYHVGVGDLDGNGSLDLVISDDGTDRYILNPVLDGATDISFAFPGTTGGFGSNSIVVDLDGDGFNEVLIADVDVDVSGCVRISDILRNSGAPGFLDPPPPTNIPGSMLAGVHDIAVFDINNDGQLDIILGRCTGTQIWINSQEVISVTFEYPGGLPLFITPDVTTTLMIEITAFGDTIQGTPSIFISSDRGAFIESALTPIEGNLYSAELPAGQCADRFDFYLRAELSGGLSFTDPATAPVTLYTVISALGTQNLINDSLEGDTSNWTTTNDASLTGGAWEAADPNATLFLGVVAAPGNDASPDGIIAFVTENGPANSQVAELWDVDGGPTTLFSPLFDLSDTDGIISYARWSFSKGDTHDSLEVFISNDGGSNWSLVEEVVDTAGSWQTKTFIVSDFITPLSQMQMRFLMSDDDNSVSEAGIDDFRVDTLACIASCQWDIAGFDGVVGINDFLDLLAAWGPNPGHPADFNDDGVVGINDFLELLAHWGPCP